MSNKIQFVWRFLDELTLADILEKQKLKRNNKNEWSWRVNFICYLLLFISNRSNFFNSNLFCEKKNKIYYNNIQRNKHISVFSV